MLELSNAVKEPEAISPGVERLMQVERSRTQKMNERNAQSAGFGVKKVLRALQDRFSDTGDFTQSIEEMVEAQVQVRTRELFRQANYDALTHLPNRTYFHATLEKLVTQARADDSEFTLLFLDLDGFKNVNDTLGHHSGDELLRNVSARLISAVREGDIVSRLGGDEFVVLLAGSVDRDITEGICSRIISEVSRVYWIDQNEVAISTSIGIARYPVDAQTSSELIDNSDKALYVSKASGRSTYRFYSDVIEHQDGQENCVVTRLDQAIQAGKIQAVFEPQIDLMSQKVVGASVTALWIDNELETPQLSGWSEILDQSEWAGSVGAWLIDSGLFYLQQWQQVNDELVVSIPVMEAIWQTENLVEYMNQRLASFQVKSSQVQLEFSLQSIANSGLLNSLYALSDAGYQITLTDVGKVPLDIAQLAQLNLQEIKLDREWLQEALATNNGQKWVKAIIQMAKVLDVCVIATGIESQAQSRLIKKMGGLMGQGSLWGQSLDADDFYRTLTDQLPVLH